MAYLIDDCYMRTKVEINGRWYVSRPLLPPFVVRLKDAWLVLTGKADAVTFYKQ